MSESEQLATESTDEASLPVKVLRTVTPGYGSRDDPEMDTIGWGIFLGMVFLLLPFLPIIALVWIVSKLIEYGRSTE